MTNQEIDTRNYINEIAEKIWSGHAAAMVGTGFSMNAKPKFESEKRIPSWNDLGIKFMEKLGMDISKNNCLFQDPIKLASEVSANFGENTLNQILIDSIPDMDYEPSELHVDFLKLNWTDVFTTNYDTLLERAAENIGVKHYSLVTKDYDLVNAIRPRIVKLHGSFPSTVPFVITEEQYRSYPKTHAAFINTVQQALVENILVLFGFSGTDPNFLNWIGWIRDNLGIKLTNKIYLVMVDNVSNAKLKLFYERNINVVDLTVFKDFDARDKNALLSFFVKELLKKKAKDKLGWASELADIDFFNVKDISLEEWNRNLEAERQTYPGWIILPKSQRKILYNKTYGIIKNLGGVKKLSNSAISINFVYEINWRLEKCLCPLFTHMQKIYAKVLGLNDDQKTIKIDSFDKSVQEKALDLTLALYRAYREDANKTKCELLESVLDNLTAKMTLSQKHRYNYEKILYASLTYDYKHFIEGIEIWNTEGAAPIWQIKRAGLLAEIGKQQDSLIILNKLLQEIRKQQGKKDIIDEYYLLSIENLTMSLIFYIQDSLHLKENSFFDTSDNNDRKYISKRYRCDVFDELDAFNFHSKQLKKELSIDNFDIGITRNEVFSETNILDEFSFLRFLEEIGYPYAIGFTTIDSDKTIYALKTVIKNQPEWCISLLMRTYRDKAPKIVLARNIIQLFSLEDIIRIINNLADVIYLFKNELAFSSKYVFFANRIVEPLFEVISRFCTKTNLETKRKICILLKDVINGNLLANPRILGSFIQRFMKSLSRSEKIEFLPILLEIKYPDDGGFLWNPCMYLNFYKDNSLNDFISNEIDDKIDDIIIAAESSKDKEKIWYVDALISLFYAGVLTSDKKEKLKSLVWSLPFDDNQLPILNHFRKFVITDLPCPDSVNLRERYVACMLKARIPDVTDNRRFVYDYPWYELTAGLDKADYYTDEYCKKTLTQMNCFWEKNSKFLSHTEDSDPIFSDKDFIQMTCRLSAEVISKIIIYRYRDLLDCTHEISKLLHIIKTLLKNYKENNIPCLSALITSILVFPEEKKGYLDLIGYEIISNDRNKVVDALSAITCIFNYKEISLEEDEFKKLINLLSDSILWQAKGDFVDCLKTFSLCLRKTEVYSIDDEVFNKILRGLRNIRISFYETNSSVEEEISIRAACAELASSLYTYFKNREIDIPTEIFEWQKICSNLEDFVEIRNTWVCELEAKTGDEIENKHDRDK